MPLPPETIDAAVVLAAAKSVGDDDLVTPRFAARLARGLRTVLKLSGSQHLVLLPKPMKRRKSNLKHRSKDFNNASKIS